MLMISKNKYYALNERCSESEFDYEKKKSTSSDDNEQENAALKICIQRSLESNLLIINLFVIF